MPRAPGTHYLAPVDVAYRRHAERERQRRSDEHRGSARDRGYDGRWEKARLGYLRKHPLCCCCEANGRIVPAVLVDHVEPHKGDKRKFWDRDNWQGLCARCHRVVKPVLERRWMLGEIDRTHLVMSRPMPEFFVDVI